MTRQELERMAKLEERNAELARENAELRKKQSGFTNGDTSNLNSVEAFFMNLVKNGKLQQLPSNYDCATLKMYISHLERENAELKARLEKAECNNVGKAVFDLLKGDILVLMEQIDWLVGKITLEIEEYKAPLEALSWDKIIEQAEQRLAELKGGGDKK